MTASDSDFLPIDDLKNRDTYGVAFRRVAEYSKKIPETPRFLLGAVPPEIMSYYYRQMHLAEQGCYVLQGARLSGRFLVEIGGRSAVCGALNIHPPYVQEERRRVSGNSPRYRRLAGTYVMITGPGYEIYGHWLLECLPKLHLMHETGYCEGPAQLLIPSDLPSFGFQWLECLGIGRDRMVLFDPSHDVLDVEELILPTVCHNGVRVSETLAPVVELLRDMLPKQSGLTVQTPAGVFLSRSKTSQSRRCLNRDRIEAAAADAGLSIVHPEELSVLEQVALFSNASVVVGEYGSAFHGAIFSPPGSLLCGLRGSRLHPGFIQSGIGTVLGQEVGYIFGCTTPGDPNESFVVPEDTFALFMETFLGGTKLPPGTGGA